MSDFKAPGDLGQNPIHAVPVGDQPQPQMVYQTVDQNGNVVYMAANPSMMQQPMVMQQPMMQQQQPMMQQVMMQGPNGQPQYVMMAAPQQQSPQGAVLYGVQQPNGTIAYMAQPPQTTTVILTANNTPATPARQTDPALVQFLKNCHGGYAVLLLVEGVMGSVLAHFGASIGVGVALPCFLGMVLALISLGAGSHYDNFLGSNVLQFVFAIISISCASAGLSQNFTLEACAVQGGPNGYYTYGHDSFFTEAIDCSSGYIYADRSCGCVNHPGTCLHFATGYTGCNELLHNAPALSLVVFLLAMAQMATLFGLLFYLVVVVDRTKL